MRSNTRLALVCGVLSLATACGSTVQVTSGRALPDGLAASTDPGLSAPGGGAPAAPGSGGEVVSGTGGGTGSPAGGTTTGTTSRPTGSGAGTTPAAVRGPLRIGVVYPDNGAANAALGVGTDTSNSPRSVMTALVTALNQQGGLAGRTLVVDYYTFDSTSSDYAAQATAACAYFTEDKPVPVVLDLAFGNKFGMAECLARKGVVDIGHATSDTVNDNKVGLFAAPAAMTSTRRYTAVLRGLHATGYLSSKNKIGVLLEDCPDLQRAYQQAVAPEISRLGLVLADTQHLSCTTGFSSAGPASASIQSAVLQLRSRDVDRVLMVSDFEQVTLLLLANHAESQGWRPGYLLSSVAQTEVMRASIASGQWPQLHGMGWSPGRDIDDPRQPDPPADQRCLALIKKGGVVVSGWQNKYVASIECALVFLLQAALQRTGGDAGGAALMAALERLGGSLETPGVVAGRAFFGPRRHDGAAAVAPFAYVTACSCLRYVGKPVPVP